MLDAASIRIVPRAVFAADQVRVRTADFMRVDFAAIKQQTEAADLLSTRTIADLMAQAVWKLIGDEERMRQLLDQDVSDIAQVRLEAFDIGKIKAACKMALQQGWDIGSKQARREIIKSSGRKYGRVLFEYDEDQHPRDENGRWTDGGGGDAPVAKVVVEYDKNVRSYRVLSLDADGNEVGDATYVGDKRTATMDAILRERDSMEFDPAKMTGSEITKAQTLLEKQASMINDALIEKGRGNEKPSETVAKKDLTSQAAKAVWDKQAALRNEVQTRAGPGHNRLPRGVGSSPRKNMSRAIFAAKPNTIRDRAAAYLDANSMRMAQNLGDGARAMIQQELTRGVRTGDTPAAIAAAILDRLESKGFTDRDGIEAAGVTQDILDELEALDDVPNVPAYINTLVRTNSFEALNEARFAEFTDPELEGWVEALEYSAVMDERTTEFCQYMDERVYRADNEVWNAYRPPNHFNCRSLLIPVTKTSGWDGVEDDPPEMQPADGFARCGCGAQHFSTARPLYVRRDLLNGQELAAWAKEQGFTETLDPAEMHVTIAYSKSPVDWAAMGDAPNTLTVAAPDARRVEPLGSEGAVVLKLSSAELSARWAGMRERGASWDYEGYQPHVTVTYKAPKTLDLSKIEPFKLSLIFGPEVFEPLDEDWKEKVRHFSYDESQHPRDENGRWTDGGGGQPAPDPAVVDGAAKIKAMPADERDDTEPRNAPGGVKAWNLYEGQKLAPKETGKLKPATDRNSLTLHNEYDAVINVGGRVYGVSKYEDPDAGEDNEDDNGNVRQYVYAYTPLDNPSLSMTETMTASVTELVAHINGKRDFSRKQEQQQ